MRVILVLLSIIVYYTRGSKLLHKYTRLYFSPKTNFTFAPTVTDFLTLKQFCELFLKWIR